MTMISGIQNEILRNVKMYLTFDFGFINGGGL